MDTSGLAWAIAYALWRQQRLLPKPGRRATGWPPGRDEFTSIAREIAEHLERAGWEVRQRPPSRCGSTP